MGLRLPRGGTRDRGVEHPPAPPLASTISDLSAHLSLALSCGQPIARRRSHRGPLPRIGVARVARSSPYVKAISFSLAEALSRVGGLTAQEQEALRGTCYGDLGSGIHAACGDPGERL